ncbi:MAG: GNAT family N-acetyltransferase [Beijerinckiaceae bacterium]
MTALSAVAEAFEAGVVVAALHPLRGSDSLAVIRDERAGDIAAREALLDSSLGEGRFAKTSERLREGRLPAEGLALSATVEGELAGTVRLWHVRAGECNALLLGPLAVSGKHRSSGLGGALMRAAIARAQGLGHEAILLVGDAPYYARFGFSADLTGGLDLPGPVDRERFLALELQENALRGACGMVFASGEIAPAPVLLEAAA